MTVKKCSKCKQVKSIDEFHKDKQKKDMISFMLYIMSKRLCKRK